MFTEQIKLLFLIIGITLISGIADSQGFLHAAKIWREGKLIWEELAKSALGFTFGIVLYWIAIGFLQQFGIISAETQTILWFGITIIGVVIFSGKLFQWAPIDRVIAIIVLAGIGWLLFRTAEVVK